LTECRQCAKAGIDHDEYIQECLSSPRIAGIRLAGFDWLKSDLHYALDRWYLRGLEEGYKRFLVMIPRGHVKTYYFGLANIIWQIIRDPECRILDTMASNTQAAKTNETLQNILMTSETLKHFFPNQVLNQKNDAHIINSMVTRISRKGIYREGTVEARGRESRVTGGHFTHQIMDDLIDENMVDSEILQEKALNFVKRADPLMVNPGEDERIITGTYWPGIFYTEVTREDGICGEDYKKLILGCYVDQRFHDFLASIGMKTNVPDGEPIFERFTKDTLERISKRDYFEFSHQYLNIPIAEEDRRFRREDIMYYNIGYTPAGEPACIAKMDGNTYTVRVSELYRTMTIDPATGEGTNTDQSAITVCGHDRKSGLVFVLKSWDGRVTILDLIEKIFEFAQEYNPHVVAPEDVSFQKTLKSFLRQEQIRRGVHFPIRPVKPGTKSKGVRILDSLQPYVQNRQVYFSRSDRALIEELVTLQVVGGKVVGRSPNLADSLSYHNEFWRGGPAYEGPEDDDVDYKPPWLESSPAYGLECLT